MDLSCGKICVVVLLVTLLPAAVLSCEGTRITGEAGQQAHIPCTFTGDTRNSYWFYQENEGMERKKVLTYFKQELTYHENYTSDHVQLDVETSTLVIMSVSIADEGIYTCDVDRINQTAVLDIVSCLDVFATPSKPFPQVTECNAFGQDETCNLFSAETETNITCILSGFYPDGKATLEWLHQDLTPESSVQEDETYILTIRSTVPREGNYTCEASYVLPNGTVTTGRKQVFFKDMEGDEEVKNAWIIIGPIAGVFVAILTVIIIITILIRWRKRRRKGTGKEKPSEKDRLELPGQPGDGTSTPEERTTHTNDTRRKSGRKQQPEDAQESDNNSPTGTTEQEPSESSSLLPGGGTSGQEEKTDNTKISERKSREKQQSEDAQESDTNSPTGTTEQEPSESSALLPGGQTRGGPTGQEEKTENTKISERPDSECVSDTQILKLSTILPGDKCSHLATFLGYSLTETHNYREKHQLDNKKITEYILTDWKIRTGGQIIKLDEALTAADCAGLIDEYKA